MRYLVVVDCSVAYVREVLSSVLANVLEVLDVDVVGSC